MMRAKKAAIAVLAALAALRAGSVQAQVKPGIERILSSEEGKSYTRGHLSYDLPKGAGGYTFAEHYGKGEYFVKSQVWKQISERYAVRLDALQVGKPFTMAGIGISYSPSMPEASYATVKYMPLWIDKQGKHLDRQVIGYSAGARIKGIDVASAGEIDIAGGPRWLYGEIGIKKAFRKHYEIGYSGALRGKGGAIPRLEHRMSIAVKK